jgi:hypothetical protein
MSLYTTHCFVRTCYQLHKVPATFSTHNLPLILISTWCSLIGVVFGRSASGGSQNHGSKTNQTRSQSNNPVTYQLPIFTAFTPDFMHPVFSHGRHHDTQLSRNSDLNFKCPTFRFSSTSRQCYRAHLAAHTPANPQLSEKIHERE